MIAKSQRFKVIQLFTTLLVILSFGCDLTGYLELTVDNSSDIGTISITVDGSSHVGEPMIFQAVTEITEAEFQWFVNGRSAGNERSLIWSFTEKGFYRVVLAVKIAVHGEGYQITTVSEELSIQ